MDKFDKKQLDAIFDLFKDGGEKTHSLWVWKWFQIWYVGSCNHDEHWGMIFECTSKRVFQLFLAFVYLYMVDVIVIVYNL